MININLSERQKKIIEIVKKNKTITSKEIAKELDLTRGALRSDLSILTMANILKAKPKVGYFFVAENSYLKNFDELYEKKVKEVKSVPIIVKEETSIYDGIVTMFLEDTGSLFVIDDNEALVGVISRKDLLKISMGENDITQLPVSIAMTRMPNIITIKDEDTIFEAAKKIVNYKVDALPVVESFTDDKIDKVDKKNNKLKIIGKVSKTNITRVFVDFKLDI
ncbi:CBS domain-containing protein [Halonatronum saccharophilum]|uniref:CBS domain-containing protein n=1 Tax=Halonatronum saccharophilum TaxID=150060 RepID=UPI000481183D|nr:helix-turn-helix transcriptional regulator [Halonatronum saccharophilum]